jgi:hypothetical protein
VLEARLRALAPVLLRSLFLSPRLLSPRLPRLLFLRPGAAQAGDRRAVGVSGPLDYQFLRISHVTGRQLRATAAAELEM